MRRLIRVLLVLGTALLLLAVPGPAPVVPPAPTGGAPFRWNRDAYWTELEARFLAARSNGCDQVGLTVRLAVQTLRQQLTRLAADQPAPDAPALDSLESGMFDLAPMIAACPDGLVEYVGLQGELRNVVKELSGRWDVTTRPARERLYRLLYGSRLAVEELILHHPGVVPALLPGRPEPSATPATEIAGVRVHSGDILVSRGGYPTSALIARGSDYPGDFSHVALVHVDESTGEAVAIEALIERGVVITPAASYLRDKKLRIMVLRPRADLPALVADPLLPHRAASRALERARSERIRYDFAMDYQDPSRQFCSEVASAAYQPEGITLWTGLSTISTPGLRRWLAGFGVRFFETQEPSDLEYDPQLVVVAEWRDEAALRDDHIDNAVIDALLEGAEAGDELSTPWRQLVVVRLAKGWSRLADLVGSRGPVPEGMSAAPAVRNRGFTERQRRIASEVRQAADRLTAEQGYPPPYWTLVELARASRYP